MAVRAIIVHLDVAQIVREISFLYACKACEAKFMQKGCRSLLLIVAVEGF